MLTILNSRSIYIGTDMKKFNEIRDYLEANRIKYKYKVVLLYSNTSII